MARDVVAEVRRFVDDEVRAAAPAFEHADAYPDALVARLRQLGLFGSLVPTEYGGLGLDVSTYARVIEELCRGFMSLAGVINSHTMAALIVLRHGTEEQRRRLLPRFAAGEARGGLCLTEPHAGSDVQAIRTRALRRGDAYLISGTKMFVTNGREGNTFALLALTDPAAQPRHRGMSCFIVEKGAPGLTVVKSIGKLGYKGVDTAELLFEELAVPAANLVGGVEGRGFAHVMGGLETGRINIAARAVGVARAAYDDTLAHVRASGGEPPAALADMAAHVRAARLLTGWAAGMKDRAERCDLEAGMAKLFASEAAHEVARTALRLHGPAGLDARRNVERHYRDTPLMIIGEGTNEIQRTIIARQLLDRYGERLGALTSREGESEERRQIVLAVRQYVEKSIVPTAQEDDRARAPAAAALAPLVEMGLAGALVPEAHGGLGVDFATHAMVLEELARGRSALAACLAAHGAVAHALAGAGRRHHALLPALARGETLGALAVGDGVVAIEGASGWRLVGEVPYVEAPAGACVLLRALDAGREGTVWFLVALEAQGVSLEPIEALGARGAGAGVLRLDGAVGEPAAIDADATLAAAHLGAAATAVGVAQAAFEAALRYAQQRVTFGKPIAQHQAIQLKLADMATQIAAARLLTYDAAAPALDPPRAATAKVFASEMAATVTVEAMRVHGGYGYTTEFPVERYYRDAARLLVTPTDNETARRAVARRLTDDATR